MQRKNIIDQEKRVRKLTYTNEESERSKLKSSSRGSILWSWFFNQTSREEELLERNKKTLEKW